MEEKIKEILLKLGADICGIANVERFIDAPSGFHPTDLQGL
jgi:epoxyqueuosine reductase